MQINNHNNQHHKQNKHIKNYIDIMFPIEKSGLIKSSHHHTPRNTTEVFGRYQPVQRKKCRYARQWLVVLGEFHKRNKRIYITIMQYELDMLLLSNFIYLLTQMWVLRKLLKISMIDKATNMATVAHVYRKAMAHNQRKQQSILSKVERNRTRERPRIIHFNNAMKMTNRQQEMTRFMYVKVEKHGEAMIANVLTHYTRKRIASSNNTNQIFIYHLS